MAKMDRNGYSNQIIRPSLTIAQPNPLSQFASFNDPSASVGQNVVERKKDLEEGKAEGRRLFYDDPDMQDIRSRRKDLAEGYSGQELGALRGVARGEIEGARKGYLANLAGNIGRAGVGGARAAAMKASANQGFQKNIADAERKMLLDSAQMKRQGTGDYQDFLMRQRFGQLATSLGYGQLGVADRGAVAQANAANSGGGGGTIWSWLGF